MFQTFINARLLRCYLSFLIVFSSFFYNIATASTDAPSHTLVIVTDRSAPTLVAAAHQRIKDNPDEQVQIRTTSQLSELNDKELQSLIDEQQQVVMIALFGESADRLLNFQYPSQQYRMVLNSDRRLLKLQNSVAGAIFANGLPAEVVDEKLALQKNITLEQLTEKYPEYLDWLFARSYWLNRSVNNAASLLSLVKSHGKTHPQVSPLAPIRYHYFLKNQRAEWMDLNTLTSTLRSDLPIVWILDHDTGELEGEWALHHKLCEQGAWQCISVLAAWGKPTIDAVRSIQQLTKPSSASVLVALQDFVLGGGEGREETLELLKKLNIPVLKGIRMDEWTQAQWEMSDEGIPHNAVHYRVAMPELQGISEPAILSLAEPSSFDALTGAKVYRSKPVDDEIQHFGQRIQHWLTLQTKTNADKHIAIVYYNHPPGRHNIGADNLNVPESLLEMLRSLKKAGYETGELPADSKALLSLLQEKGINLPEDKEALTAMSSKVATLSADNYGQWFNTLPESVKAEMENGPLAALHVMLKQQASDLQKLQQQDEIDQRVKLLTDRVSHTLLDLRHVLDGTKNQGRERALDLLTQLEDNYLHTLKLLQQKQQPDWTSSEQLLNAIQQLQIEGLRGWGKAPGKVMVWDHRMLIPGVQFGNVFIGPQPPRGWELNEELLHANLSFPPPHQYLGFYHYIHDVFKADAMIHVGRHSTYEFLPKRGVGLTAADYPRIIGDDLPSVYPYIVDGVGEGIQAKRRGMAVMIDHLTPPLATTQLYDDLLSVRQIIESAESTSDAHTRHQAVLELRKKIDALHLREELIANMSEELKVRGLGFEDIDDALLLHEVGHYLTKLQERFMPLGLHVFGRDWQPQAVDTMLHSMIDRNDTDPAKQSNWRELLAESPAHEMSALLAGLNGRYIEPGKGNDPIRTPEALPTGRNFYALDGSLLPTKLAFTSGSALADQVLSGKSGVAAYTKQLGGNKQGVILWASDVVRDEGTMIAFGLKLMGVQPVWNSRGIIKGLERLPLSDSQPKRYDVVFTTSGLFRDLYGQHLMLLDKASLLALDASRDTIIRDYPALTLALQNALKPLGEWQKGGSESLEQNQVAANWVDEARKLLAKNPKLADAQLGRQASIRVFGIAPGAYGAGINRIVERSGAWKERRELADIFVKRMGHAYGANLDGDASQELFRMQLDGISQTYLGRASNLYGLMDNNDAFDYLGGLNLAVEMQQGHVPASSVINHANEQHATIDALPAALLGELRGRFLNPQWIKPLMKEGYSGARTMGSEFIEYLWGWQVTSPDIIDDHVWQEVKSVYIDDKYKLGMKQFLNDGDNRYVQTNMLAVMLVAIDKGFWKADQATIRELSEKFAKDIIEHGNPGSGHTHANHPMYKLVEANIDAKTAQALKAKLDRERLDLTPEATPVKHIQEVAVQDKSAQSDAASQSNQDKEQQSSQSQTYLYGVAALMILLLIAGFIRGRKSHA